MKNTPYKMTNHRHAHEIDAGPISGFGGFGGFGGLGSLQDIAHRFPGAQELVSGINKSLCFYILVTVCVSTS